MINEKSELNEDFIREAIVKAGGANYGTGTRDWRRTSLISPNKTVTYLEIDSAFYLSRIFI